MYAHLTAQERLTAAAVILRDAVEELHQARDASSGLALSEHRHEDTDLRSGE